MPLSEQEQRLLDEMERNLYQHDADFVAAVGGHRGKPNYRGIVLGAILLVAGISTLLIGVGAHLAIVGVVGFVLMFAGVLVAITPSRSTSTAMPTAAKQQEKRSAGFMDSLNDRWDRRQENRDE